MRHALTAAGLWLLALFCGAPAIAADSGMTATPAIWVAHGLKGTAYLLGSIHALPKNVNWQTPQITAAIQSADTFVFEIPLDKDGRAHGASLFARNGLFPLSDSLPSYFDAEMRSEYRDVIMLTRADPTYLVYMRPWLAALVLQGVADGGTGFIAAEGVDNKVYAEATARGVKNFRALETAEFQIRLLMGNGNLVDEVEMLRATFKKILVQHDEPIGGLLAAWAKGDTKKLASYGPESAMMTPLEKKALLEDRNRAWIPQIVAMLNEKHTYFITVGAAHLVGKTGVPNLLRAAGYKVDGP